MLRLHRKRSVDDYNLHGGEINTQPCPELLRTQKVRMTPDGKFVITVTGQTLSLTNLNTHETHMITYNDKMDSWSISPDGSMIAMAVSNEDGVRITIKDVLTDAVVFETVLDEGLSSGFAWSKDGSTLAYQDPDLVLRSTVDFSEIIRGRIELEGDYLSTMTFLHDGSGLLIVDYDTIILVDCTHVNEDGEFDRTTIAEHIRCCESLRVSPDDRYVVAYGDSCRGDTSVTVTDINEQTIVSFSEFHSEVACVEFTQDSNSIIVVTEDGLYEQPVVTRRRLMTITGSFVDAAITSGDSVVLM
jgi:Tol biopolymer transport system component